VGAPSGGRPVSVDTEGFAAIEAALQEADLQKKPFCDQQLEDLVAEQELATKKRRLTHPEDKVFDETVKPPPRHVLRQLAGRKGVSHAVAQDLTQARLKALQDMRAIFIMSIVLYCLGHNLPAAFKWNAGEDFIYHCLCSVSHAHDYQYVSLFFHVDCTTYLCVPKGGGKYWFWRPLLAEHGDDAEYQQVNKFLSHC